MLRAFDAFQQFPDVVEIDTRPQPAKAPGLDVVVEELGSEVRAVGPTRVWNSGWMLNC